MDVGEKSSVLLVDDRPEKLLAIEAALADLPLELVRAYSGRDALRCLLAREFAVILLDVNMPSMDGFETAQLIRQRKLSESTPIIFLTAYSDEVFMSRGYSLGAVDYILQPVVPQFLRSKISVFVDLYRKNRLISEQAKWQTRRAGQLQKLASASVAINAAKTTARTLQIITDSARDVIGSHQAITLRINHGDDAPAKTRAFCSFSDKYASWRGRDMNLDMVASSMVAANPGPTRLLPQQLPHHPDFAMVRKLENHQIPVVRGLLAAPLIDRESKTAGVIYLSDKIEGEFTSDDEAILVQLTQMASVALDNIQSAEAREANRAKDQFIAVLSHELRTPLTPVLATLAGMQSDKRLPDDIQEDLIMLRRNVELEARLIDDLLDLTRISKGKVELQLETIDVNELLHEAADICRSEIVEKKIELFMDLAARKPWVKGDATRLQQVFWNLIKNAVKFTPAGGRITIESGNVEGSDEGDLCIRVIDSGIGIEPEILPRIFQAFEQGNASITRQFGGLGLGLAISKTLIDHHGGTLVAYSAGRNKGAAFIVTLPVTRDQPQADTYPPPRLVHAAPHRVLRVLLVEDHRDTARVMSKLLRNHGFGIECAVSLAEAVACLKKSTFDVLVSDIGLPDGTGLELMRQAVNIQPIIGIALSGFGMEHDIRSSKEAGFAVHLTKPINFQLLIETIERVSAAAAESPLAKSTLVAG